MDVHWGYEKNSVTDNNSDNSRNGSYLNEHGEIVISISCAVMANLSRKQCLSVKVVVSIE